MNTVRVELGFRSYDIRIEYDALARLRLSDDLRNRQVLIVTDENVAPLYLDNAAGFLAPSELATLILPAGEQHKTLKCFEKVIDTLVERGLRRDALLVALGGGVIGDMAGFAAACYLRGIAWLQIPTTLLAQVDASVGGKTAVNHPLGKNLIGAFHQPDGVVADVATLDTLPEREYRAGLAEVIKYGAGLSKEFFDWLDGNMESLVGKEREALIYAVTACCRLKAAIVMEDERDQGRRALLNLGHTFAHALEVSTGYSQLLHGEAVAIGLALAARLSVRRGGLDQSDANALIAIVNRAGLGTTLPNVDRRALLDALKHDKKVTASGPAFVLLNSRGSAFVSKDVPAADLTAVLDESSA